MLNNINKLKGQDAISTYARAMESLVLKDNKTNGRIQITNKGFMQKSIIGNWYRNITPAQALASLSGRVSEGVILFEKDSLNWTNEVAGERAELKNNPFFLDLIHLIAAYTDDLGETVSFEQVTNYVSYCAREQVHQNRVEESSARRKKYK